MPVAERRLEPAGIPTAVLEGGDGPPVVLLHGPGEFALGWLRVIPGLAKTHRVVAPDLPGHGARFAGTRRDRLARLALVDTFGLRRLRPRPLFALTLIGFLARPTDGSRDRLFRQCFADLDGLREQLDSRREPLMAYGLEGARSPHQKAALRSLMPQFELRAIPAADLARISIPTTLIWGRHDRQTPLRVAEAVSARYGWPLHVIENAADDPAFEQPEAFLGALRAALGRS